MRTSDFNFDLPVELIAQRPVEPRDRARLLRLNGVTGEREDRFFSDLPEILRPDDLLVVNNTKVIPARLWGAKPTGGRVEVLLLSREGEDLWEALVRSSKKPKPGLEINLEGGKGIIRVEELLESGRFRVRVSGGANAEAVVERAGQMPLPPYIRREEALDEDKRWYQTVFADPELGGSAAAPTAGLHFTDRVLERLDERGIERAEVTLHVGLGTFAPVRTDNPLDHPMHREWYSVSEETAGLINRCLDEGRRVVSVGTTVTRVLEHAGLSGRVEPGSGWTDIFIHPGCAFRVIGALLTNFHLPESTLLMLVCAFGGMELVLEAYEHAVAEKYRFYSYGDAMFLER